MSINSSSSRYDVLVLGGGITGVGVALELAKANRRVALLEKDTLLSQTSANSLRIIHGGFRYLQSLDILRVLESAKCQFSLLQDYPDFIKPLPCVMPLQKSGLKSAPFARLGIFTYSLIHFLRNGSFANGKILSVHEVEKTIPLLRGRAPHGALYWEDAQIVDLVGFHARLREELASFGVDIFEGKDVTEVSRAGSGYTATCAGHEESLFRGRVLINTLGPWVHSIARPVSVVSAPKQGSWCTGFNMVSSKPLATEIGVGIQSSRGRLLFASPRNEGSALGTWYLPFRPIPLTIRSSEVAVALKELNETLPALGLREGDLLSIEQGKLPQARIIRGEPVPLGRQRIRDVRGYIEVLSTKYTTFRSSAQLLGTLSRRYL